MSVSVLDLKREFWRIQGLQWPGVVLSATPSTIISSDLIFGSDEGPVDPKGMYVRMVSGNTDEEYARVTAFNPSTGQITFMPALSTAPVAADRFELWGGYMHPGKQLTDQVVATLRTLPALRRTKLTLVDSQREYDLSDYIDERLDVVECYIRTLDPANVEPYRERVDIGFRVDDELMLRPGSILPADGTVEYYVRHFGGLTVIPPPGSPVPPDVVLDTFILPPDGKDDWLNWIAWEVVLDVSTTMATRTTDQKRWQALSILATQKCFALRREHAQFQRRNQAVR